MSDPKAPKPFDPDDPVHVAVLAMARAEHAYEKARRRNPAQIIPDAMAMVERNRARVIALEAITEALMAAGDLDTLRSLRLSL